MKLPEALRRKQDDDPLDERIAAELDALDSALRGERVGPEMSSIATLASDLRAEREGIESDFSATLDAWADAGFPRGERPGASPSPGGAGAGGAIERLRLRFASTPPRRLLGPALAAASVAVVAAVVISQSNEIGGSGSGAGSGEVPVSEQTIHQTATPPSADGAVVPESAGGRSALDAQSSAAAARGENLSRIRKDRKVERDAQLSLAAEAKDVPGVAARASDVTERYNGHVLSSAVSGSSQSARATLELAIPSKNLDAAISDLSDLAEVSSRSENSNDITRPFISARDELSGLRAERDSLITRLAAASTDQETADLKAKLESVNSQIASARASVQNLRSRAQISHVTLQISSDGMIGDPGAKDSGWGIGDALHDAGHVLTVAAGIALISGAVLLPLALIALLIALVFRANRSKARERALDV